MVNFELLMYYRKNFSLYARLFILALLFCCMAMPAMAQPFVLKGVIFKNNTSQRLSKVLVANLNNNAIVTSDDMGVFQINCSIGDSILFRQKDYADQKIGIITQNTLMVNLNTNIRLSEVEIKGTTKKQELQQVMGEYNSQGVYSNGKPSVASAILSPLNALYDVFGSGPKQVRHFKEYSANELEQTEVDKRFTRPLVKRITAISDSAKLELFVQNYRPSYADIKDWNDYELINYIRKSYQNFEDNGEKPPPVLQKLVAPKSPASLGGN